MRSETVSPPSDSGSVGGAWLVNAAMARKLSGNSSMATIRTPRLVVSSFQRRWVYSPTPKSAAETPLNSENLSSGRWLISAQKLMTRAIEQPTMSRPPTSSPQRMFFSSRKAERSFPRAGRGGAGAAGGLRVEDGGLRDESLGDCERA